MPTFRKSMKTNDPIRFARMQRIDTESKLTRVDFNRSNNCD